MTRYMCTSHEFFDGEPLGLFVLYALHANKTAVANAANRYLHGCE